MGIAGLEEQIPFPEIVVPEMGSFGPIVRFIDCGNATASINNKNTENTEKIDEKRDWSPGIDRRVPLLLGSNGWESCGHYSETSDKLGLELSKGLEHCEHKVKQEKNNDQATNDYQNENFPENLLDNTSFFLTVAMWHLKLRELIMRVDTSSAVESQRCKTVYEISGSRSGDGYFAHGL